MLSTPTSLILILFHIFLGQTVPTKPDTQEETTHKYSIAILRSSGVSDHTNQKQRSIFNESFLSKRLKQTFIDTKHDQNSNGDSICKEKKMRIHTKIISTVHI